MDSPKKKSRQYSTEYLKFGFACSPANRRLSMCLICEKVFSNEAMKASRLKEHFTREKISSRRTLPSTMASESKLHHDGLLASYRIALMIAKSGKPHSIGEDLILPATAEIQETVLHQPAPTIVSKIPLSRRTVQRRIDAMAQHTEATLCGILKNTESALKLDESTLPGNEGVLLAYVRFIKQERLVQEFLFAKELLTDTNGESIIFEVVNDCFKEKQIPFKDMLAVATDGAPSMVGRYRDFVAYLKEVLPDVLAMHCVVHRQRLVVKRLSARLKLQYVIQAVNRIKANALSDRLFRQLCDENDEKFNHPLLHTEVRCLSKGTCLTRFYELFGSVIQFFEEHDRSLCENLRKSKMDITYLADLYFKFSEMNKQLQSNELNLIKAKVVMSAFLSKLMLFKCSRRILPISDARQSKQGSQNT
ncbi:hypothetical protein M514_02402 [Trichuris suis]|uniref:DUF4371 domain-containing protein n=1 Tax=Trichuris suis TaxID=68888 RepID=A0A085N5S6_9BILA|nr:hypothetical protein M514_02402 [Trichuris suis]